MASTHDWTPYTSVGNIPYYEGAGRFGVARFHIDMAAIHKALAEVIDGSASDVLQIWDIPAGAHILSARAYLWTPEGSAATITLGDGDSPAGFLASFSINGLAKTTKMTLTTDAYGATCGRTYNATDTLDIVFGTHATIDTAVFDISVACIFFDEPDLATSAPSTWK